MMRILLWFCLLTSGLLWISCKPDPAEILDRGEAYFPLEVGRQLVYQVDSIIFDDAGNSNRLDTFSGFIRETITDAYLDSEMDSVFVIERAFRRTEMDSWQAAQIWTASRTYSTAFRVEENQRLVKMEFPLYRGRKWNPVRYVDPGIVVPVGTEEIELFAYWSGEVLALDESELINNFNLDRVLTCIQADEDTEIERRFVLEKYARDIGLVARMDTILDSRCKRIGDFTPCIGLDWMEKGEKGYIMSMKLISHN